MQLLVEQKENLANLYLLPLLKRRSSDFIEFVNCYLDVEEFQLAVEVPDIRPHYKDYSYYNYYVSKDSDRHLLFYDIPKIFHEDVALFVQGKYSEFSDGAKAFIYKYGSFTIIKHANGTESRSVWLLVLDKAEALKDKLEDQLNSTIPEDNELASPPDTNNFL